MERKIKLIWDFHGPDAKQMAEHHAIHLSEFAIREKLVFNETGIAEQSEKFCIAYLMVAESEMIKVRDALRPHRGQAV